MSDCAIEYARARNREYERNCECTSEYEYEREKGVSERECMRECE